KLDNAPGLAVGLIARDLERQRPGLRIFIVNVQIHKLFACKCKLIELRSRRWRFNMRQHLLQISCILRSVLRIMKLAIDKVENVVARNIRSQGSPVQLLYLFGYVVHAPVSVELFADLSIDRKLLL